MAFVWLTAVILLLAATLGLHWWWRRRFLRSGQYWKETMTVLRRQQQETEAQARDRQQALLNSMVEGVLLLDATGRIEVANDAFGRLFRVANDLRGRPLIEAVRSHELADLVGRLAQELSVRGFEFRLDGGETRWIEVNAAAVQGREGQPGGFILVFHDLTRLKRLETTRQEFVANVSHELRTPVSLIQGFLESLLGGAKDNPELNERFLRTIDRNARRLGRLIEDLLTISELESGRNPLRPQPVELHALVDEVLDEFRTVAGARQVRLVNEVPALRVRADPDRLHQIFSNLIDNAVKYGRREGTVVVAGRTLPDDQVELSVRDDGPGLPADAVPRVFERFYRVDRARSREQGGTGLGLSIVKHLVQSHGGKVWVESEPGHGARFCFTLVQISEIGRAESQGSAQE